jgi:hypothetical protein
VLLLLFEAFVLFEALLFGNELLLLVALPLSMLVLAVDTFEFTILFTLLLAYFF